jgi:hypothetical protein
MEDRVDQTLGQIVGKIDAGQIFGKIDAGQIFGKIDAVQKIGPGYSYEKGGHFSVKKRGWTEYH